MSIEGPFSKSARSQETMGHLLKGPAALRVSCPLHQRGHGNVTGPLKKGTREENTLKASIEKLHIFTQMHQCKEINHKNYNN